MKKIYFVLLFIVIAAQFATAQKINEFESKTKGLTKFSRLF